MQFIRASAASAALLSNRTNFSALKKHSSLNFNSFCCQAAPQLPRYSSNDLEDLLSASTSPRSSIEYSPIYDRAITARLLGRLDCPAIEFPPKTLSLVDQCVELLVGQTEKKWNSRRSVELLRCLSVLRDIPGINVFNLMALAQEAAGNILSCNRKSW